MSKAYNNNGVSTPQFRIDNKEHHTLVKKSVDQLMHLGYTGQDVSYFLCGIVQLSVSSNNITSAFKQRKESK
jgi:hypothetical protein